MYASMPCVYCIISLVCHKHNSLPLVLIQPSSPSTKERHGSIHQSDTPAHAADHPGTFSSEKMKLKAIDKTRLGSLLVLWRTLASNFNILNSTVSRCTFDNEKVSWRSRNVLIRNLFFGSTFVLEQSRMDCRVQKQRLLPARIWQILGFLNGPATGLFLLCCSFSNTHYTKKL